MSMHDEGSDRSSGSRIEEFPETQSTGAGGMGMGERSRSAGSTASIKEKARETKDRVMSKGSDAVQQAKEKTRTFADDGKNRLGERIHGYGSAARRAAEKLRDEKDPNIAHYAEMVAERLDQAADYVQSRDPGMMLRDVENAVRRRPEIFFGGMFLAGLVLARFLKASNQRDYDYEGESDEDYWVEDSSYQEEELTRGSETTDPSFAMSSGTSGISGTTGTTGESAGGWKAPNQPGSSMGGGNI